MLQQGKDNLKDGRRSEKKRGSEKKRKEGNSEILKKRGKKTRNKESD